MITVRLQLLTTFCIALLCLPAIAAAATLFNTLTEPYAIYELEDDLPAPYSVYGELINEPDTYQFTLQATTTVSFVLYAIDEYDETPLFSTILVRDYGNQGVREVKRMRASVMEWQEYQDSRTKMSYKQAKEHIQEIAPGIYRIEVSTPDNQGLYRLDIEGEGDEAAGYFTQLAEIRSVQSFHGYGWHHMLRTGAVQTPLFLIVVLVGMYMTWRYVRRHSLILGI